MLKKISIRINFNEKLLKHPFYSADLEILFYYNLGKIDCGLFKYISIYFTSEKDEVEKIVTDHISYHVFFDFKLFYSLINNYEKKLYITDRLYYGLCVLSKKYSWDIERFCSAYEKSKNVNLSLNWFYKRKLFQSPNKKYYFGLFHVVEIGEYNIYEILYNNKKKEIAKRLCFTDTVSVFRIAYASWENNSEIFYYRFNGPNKTFAVKVTDLLNGEKYKMIENTSAFFK